MVVLQFSNNWIPRYNSNVKRSRFSDIQKDGEGQYIQQSIFDSGRLFSSFQILLNFATVAIACATLDIFQSSHYIKVPSHRYLSCLRASPHFTWIDQVLSASTSMAYLEDVQNILSKSQKTGATHSSYILIPTLVQFGRGQPRLKRPYILFL